MDKNIEKAFTGIKCVLVAFCVSLLSCEAPHKNPLDPKNPDFNFATLSGKIMTKNAGTTQNVPLSDVMIDFHSLRTFTDQKGYFEWNEIFKMDGWIYFRKNGFFDDSLFIHWQSHNEISVTDTLKKVPVLVSLHAYSVVVHNYPALKEYKVTVRAEFTDALDNNDSVLVINKELNKPQRLYNLATKVYQMDSSVAVWGFSSIQDILLAPFELWVNDQIGHQTRLGSDKIQRIIDDEIIPLTPKGAQVVQQNPVLQWQAVNPDFDFTYTVELYDWNAILPFLSWSSGDIQSEITSKRVPIKLVPGNYLWVVWCVDKYYNRSSSKRAFFVVE
jgi:hypothetical protein